jgi:hypothetical protein
MNDNTMCIRMENNKFQYAYELPEDYDYEVIQCNTSNDNYLKKKIILKKGNYESQIYI